MEIKHIHIENFRSIKEFDADFSDNTLISGANEVGKSTVRNAIFYVLMNKMADGSSPENIRPHDKDGKDIDNIDITVELTLDIDGRKVTLKKTERQKWTKHRGSESPVYEGNETVYEINQIPKKLKDYQAFINDIVDAESLLYGTNAQAFLNLDVKKRRAKLMSFASDITIEDIAKSDSKYEPIIPILSDGTFDELISRSRKIIKVKNDQLADIPVRIDELNHQIAEIDTAELELMRNQLKEDIAKVEAEITSASNKAVLDDLGQQKLDLMFEINDIKRKANEANMSRRHELNSKLAMIEIEIENAQSSIKESNRQIELLEIAIKTNSEKIDLLKPEYNKAKNSIFDESAWVFDDNTTICSLCGQRLPEDRIAVLKKEFALKKEAAKKAFDHDRNSTIERIKTEGNNLAKDNQEYKKKIADKQSDIEVHNKTLDKNQKELARVKSELALVPTDPDMSKIDKYNSLNQKLSEIDAEIKKNETDAPDISSLETKKNEIESQLESVTEKLARGCINSDIEERIKALTAEQRRLAQEIADEEKIRDLLESLNKLYVETTTDTINSHFKYIKWKMFKQNITNAGYEAICEPTYNGTGYFKGLNHGARLLCEIDLCMAFQDMSGKKLFITLDDAESVDSWRLPKLDRQMIVFRRTDDKNLTVTAYE